MNVLIVFSILFMIFPCNAIEVDSKFDLSAEVAFKEFVIRFNKTYVNDWKEYSLRLKNFKASLKRHSWLNDREKELGGTAEYGVNKFSDLTPDEFKDFLRSGFGPPQPMLVQSVQKVNCSRIACMLAGDLTPSKIPVKKDWRNTPSGSKITSVRNQGKCGGCWAFTAVETIESRWAIAGNPLQELSVQELISCAKGDFLRGCKGGNTCDALLWLLIGGNKKKPVPLVPESEYPFEMKDSSCKFTTIPTKGVTITDFCGCKSMLGCEFSLMSYAVGVLGPVGINVDAVLWHDYVDGIIQHHCSNQMMNHAVVIVGYDKTGPIPYWIIKNSWGPDFGIDGYLHIKMGENLCGVTEQPSFALV